MVNYREKTWMTARRLVLVAEEETLDGNKNGIAREICQDNNNNTDQDNRALDLLLAAHLIPNMARRRLLQTVAEMVAEAVEEVVTNVVGLQMLLHPPIMPAREKEDAEAEKKTTGNLLLVLNNKCIIV